ncbi:GxxExxY protein [Tangfeifania diversioriginum]|uniref:GxxExxY protein n=1 Tax=Tangfeifania diversioriginum TaxID=1168035 RepID=UPI0029371073|nr:GxxExxY protein [Tangfeifania diversioriginum]
MAKIAKKKQMTENDITQLLTYLKLSEIKPGQLINFNSKTLKDNIHRVVNNL